MTQNLYSIVATVAGSDLAPMTFIVIAANQKDAMDAAIQDALLIDVDEALLEAASFSVQDISQAAFEFVDEQLECYEPALFQKCVDAACGDEEVARDVIQTLIDNSDSAYTIEELSLVLAQEEA